MQSVGRSHASPGRARSIVVNRSFSVAATGRASARPIDGTDATSTISTAPATSDRRRSGVEPCRVAVGRRAQGSG